MAEQRKTIENSIKYLLKTFPAVAIIGGRQVGKTTLINHLFSRDAICDLEREDIQERLQEDLPFFIKKKGRPLVFDEAQEMPSLFPAIRVAIDETRDKNGQFVITGSSSPLLLDNITESLAGRVAIFEMSGFDLREEWQREASDFYDVVKKGVPDKLLSLVPRVSYEELLKSCVYGSYPEAFTRSRRDPLEHQLWMENYFKTYIDRDVRKLFPGLNIQSYQRFIAMLSQSASEVLNLSDFARSLGISQPTVAEYLRIAEGSFVWRRIPVFSRKSKTQIIKHPKGYVRDSGLLFYNCRLRSFDNAMNNPLFGRVWESFISEEIIKGFKNRLIPLDYYYYRTKSGVEVDLIIDGDFGTIPIEIKYGTSIDVRKVRWLKDFVNAYNCPYGLVISNTEKAQEIADKIFELPAGVL